MTDTPLPGSKIAWRGLVTSVQPRIRLTRSFDERRHSYLGYVLIIQGEVDGPQDSPKESGVLRTGLTRNRGLLRSDERVFTVAVGPGAHEKHQFCAGDTVSGFAVAVEDTRLETAEFYQASGLKKTAHEAVAAGPASRRRSRSTESEAAGGWPLEHTPPSATPASGDAGWRWR